MLFGLLYRQKRDTFSCEKIEKYKQIRQTKNEMIKANLHEISFLFQFLI